MSGRTAKAARRDEEERKTLFLKAMDEASAKYKIGLIPVLQYTDNGVVPTLAVIDEKNKYGAVTEEAKKQNELEESAKVDDPQKADPPKIVTA